jgi:hypothetical protein
VLSGTINSEPMEDYPLRNFINVIVENTSGEPATNCEARLRLLDCVDGCKTSNTHEKRLVWENGSNKTPISGHSSEKFQIAFSQEKLTDEQNGKIANVYCGKLDTRTTFHSWFATQRALKSVEYADADGLCLGEFKIHIDIKTERGHRISSDFIIRIGENWRDLEAEMNECNCKYKKKSFKTRLSGIFKIKRSTES